MIVSASYRTDIPAFYGDWFVNRLAAGGADVRNPYGGRPYHVSLRPDDVTGFVFWTRNLGPFFPALTAVADMAVPFIVQMTVIGYPRALDAAVIPSKEAVAQVRAVGDRFGPDRVVWRYDPVVMTDATPPDWHRANFARLADALAEDVDEVVVSTAQIYRKTQRGLDAAEARHGFAWYDPPDAEKGALLADLMATAQARGLTFSLCAQPPLHAPGMAEARCIDAERLGRIAGRPLTARQKGYRPGCRCAEARDIGAYDTCPHGCVYCYAVRDKAKAAKYAKAHDPQAPAL